MVMGRARKRARGGAGASVSTIPPLYIEEGPELNSQLVDTVNAKGAGGVRAKQLHNQSHKIMKGAGGARDKKAA